jgi:cyclophilin family peptidyl-prolyl cis-trans isomerase/HEAT repeat protein
VDEIAAVLQVEDARRFDPTVLTSGARAADPIVRRRAAMALGRIGTSEALPLLLELLTDPDSTVQRDAAFALGLIGDPRAAVPLRQLLIERARDADPAVGREVVTALARIGGPVSAAALSDLLQGSIGTLMADNAPPALALRALEDAWRLDSLAPISTLIQMADARTVEVRRAAVYSLGRLRAVDAGAVLLNAARDEDATVRHDAVRTLTAAYADSTGLGRDALSQVVARATDDDDDGVRIQALRALATYRDSAFAGAALDQVTNPSTAVRVEALNALGALGGTEAAEVLFSTAKGAPFAMGRSALLGLVRADRTLGIRAAAAWITNADWRKRMVGAEALGVLGGDTALTWVESMLDDPDGRVVARAYGALIRGDSLAGIEMARDMLRHRDVVVRTLAAGEIAKAPTVGDIPMLTAAYRRAEADAIPDAAIAVVEALGALTAYGPSQAFAVEDQFLSQVPTSDNYLIRRAAADHLPAAATQWGPEFPVETGRSLEDYREIVRRLVLPAEFEGTLPGLVMETDKGPVEIDLFADAAPLTVNAILELVDRGYFNGRRWHRVVPDFVIQDGDPRGDGWGGPGFALRDEVNRQRYRTGTIGMALSGPHTGGSQFFITLAPQPHLDGTYTVFGAVETGMDAVQRIAQGDGIWTVKRR